MSDWDVTKSTGDAPPRNGLAGVPIDVADVRDAADNKVIAALAYAGPLVLVALLLGRQSPFARFHVNQGLVFAITWIVLWVAGLITNAILAFIPILGWIAAGLLSLAIFVGWAVFAVIGVTHALNGRVEPLPVIGKSFSVLS